MYVESHDVTVRWSVSSVSPLYWRSPHSVTSKNQWHQVHAKRAAPPPLQSHEMMYVVRVTIGWPF
jgi:hypothetical protein